MNRNCWILLAAVAGALLSGCSAPEPRPDPRQAGLKDPMNYNPTGNDWPTVSGSGGGIMDYDKKAMKRDMNNVLNP